MTTRRDESPTETLADVIELAQRVRAKRRSLGVTIREAAADAGVSAPTLSRVERGHLPERENLLRLARWADIRIDPLLHDKGLREEGASVHGPNATTVEAVELHLRADDNLSREDAEALSEMFRLAYGALAQKQSRKQG